ncbi:DUF3298 and DUF4163 domain-containing protein [Leptobacterium sp. I13]|uniref:DUF3298 and DUF4163 domain-containing protein n=1 Tax=Leptobacterium meishanense TaxID=3128904 RepID=UPI0030EC6FF2
MNRYFINSLIVILLFSCSNEKTLTFNTLEIESEECPQCPEIAIAIPRASSSSNAATELNAYLSEWVIELLNYPEENTPETIEGAIVVFKNSYQELQDEFSEAVPWEVAVDGMVTYQSKRYVCIQLNSYISTGGAHGYGATHFLLFDARSGKPIKFNDLLTDKKGFISYAEIMFRQQENVPLNENINSTGFMFENDAFYLPENIGLTDEGLVLQYNQYEIASYADGQKMIILPYDKILSFIELK